MQTQLIKRFWQWKLKKQLEPQKPTFLFFLKRTILRDLNKFEIVNQNPKPKPQTQLNAIVYCGFYHKQPQQTVKHVCVNESQTENNLTVYCVSNCYCSLKRTIKPY